MQQYLDLIQHVLENGRTKANRSGFWVRSEFGNMCRYDLEEGFPLVTTKRMPQKVWIHELLWWISGDCTNTKTLRDRLPKDKIKIWDIFADEEGNIGPLYGYQWRNWPGYDGKPIDQLQNVIDLLKTDPNSRAMIVSAWNTGQLKEMRLPPCHTFFQLYARKDELSMMMYQRSGDVLIGIPFNIAQYSLLLMMIAQVTGFKAKEFVHVIGDAHIYKNYKEQALEQISRKPYPLPKMILNSKIKNIDDFKIEDFKIEDYQHHPPINMNVNLV